LKEEERRFFALTVSASRKNKRDREEDMVGGNEGSGEVKKGCLMALR
jgi:hypothetical protein